MPKTFYRNREGEIIPADVTVLNVTPQDTTVRVTPNTGNGTTHWVTYGQNNIVKEPDGFGGTKETDVIYHPYWQDAARQAYNNRERGSQPWYKRLTEGYHRYLESYKPGGSVKCAECGDKMSKKKLVKKHQAGNAFKGLVNKSYNNITIPNHGAGAMGLEGIDRAYNQYKNTLGKEAAGDWKFNALGSLLTGAALGPLVIPTSANSALVPTYSTLMVKSLIPDDTATAKKRKEVQPISTELENSTLQQILDLPKELLDNIAGYIAPSLIENKKKNETTRGSKTGTDKTRK